MTDLYGFFEKSKFSEEDLEGIEYLNAIWHSWSNCDVKDSDEHYWEVSATLDDDNEIRKLKEKLADLGASYIMEIERNMSNYQEWYNGDYPKELVDYAVDYGVDCDTDKIDDYISDVYMGKYSIEEFAEHLALNDTRIIRLPENIRDCLDLKKLYKDEMTYNYMRIDAGGNKYHWLLDK